MFTIEELIKKSKKDIARKMKYDSWKHSVLKQIKNDSDEFLIKAMIRTYTTELKRIVNQNIPSKYDIVIIQSIVKLLSGSEDIIFHRSTIIELKEILEIYSIRDSLETV